MASIDEMFDHLESEHAVLTSHEEGWIKVLKDFYKRQGFLTERQKVVVRDIYFRNSHEVDDAMQEFNEYMNDIYLAIVRGEIEMTPDYKELLATQGIFFVDSSDETERIVAPESSPSVQAILNLLIEKGVISGEEFRTKLSQVQTKV